jgi:class 3 adenylate cyclase
MALFGTEASLTSAQMAQHAVCAALDILTAVAGLNQRLDILRDQPLRVGIGIHLGQVVLGKNRDSH